VESTGGHSQYIFQIIMKQLDILETISTPDSNTGSPDAEVAEVIREFKALLKTNSPTVILAADGSRVAIEQVREKRTGDTFENIGAGATVINRSSLQNSVNSIRASMGDEVAEALQRAAEIIGQSANEDAAENLNALSEELEKPYPRRGLLRSFWFGIVTALPTVVELTDLHERMSKLFS
jgi:hypothetical protein